MIVNISVALGTYNGDNYLQEQLDSLAKQTILPYELVVCDDGSEDKTVEILKSFAASAPFPVHIYVNETNLGFADNFLKAAKLCKADWIAFCDQDDVWLTNKIAKVNDAILSYSNDELVLIGHTSLLTQENLVPTGQRMPDYKCDIYTYRAKGFGIFGVHGFSMVFNSRLIKEFDLTLRPSVPDSHDIWISMLANSIGDIAYISEPLALWRRHDGSLSRPSKTQTIIDQATIAMTALIPAPYIEMGNMAKKISLSFQSLGENSTNNTMKERLMIGSTNYLKLADNYFQRADLYKCQGRISKLKVLANLFLMNGYGGLKFNSLGWKSFIKDVAFAFGIIG